MEPNFNQTDAAFLEQYYGNWTTLKGAGYIKMLDPWVRQEYLDITRRALDPRTLVCLTCPDDVLHMIRVLYTNFDKWKTSQRLADALPPEPVDQPSPEPETQEPFIFPDGLDNIKQEPEGVSNLPGVDSNQVKESWPQNLKGEPVKKKGRPKK